MEKPFEIVREKMHTGDGVTRHGLDMGKPDEPDIWTYRKSGYDKSMCSKLVVEEWKRKIASWRLASRSNDGCTGCTVFLTFATRDGARWPPPIATRMSHRGVFRILPFQEGPRVKPYGMIHFEVRSIGWGWWRPRSVDILR